MEASTAFVKSRVSAFPNPQVRFCVGEMVGAYQIVSLIGQGGAGQVFKVEHTVTKRIEAIKVLFADKSREDAQRFLREVQIHASLSHPNIASVHNAFWAGDNLVMAMEFVEGESLRGILERERIPVRVAINYICQALCALDYAHDHKVTHRDITPGNLLVTAKGEIKITDFGLAKLETDPRLTQNGRVVGSLYYMSPEQVRPVSDIDPRMDIYSIGVVLYEAVTGSKPFSGDSEFSVMLAHLGEEPLAPNALEPALPLGLSEIILKALAKIPQDRFQSAGEFRLALESCCNCENETGISHVLLPVADSQICLEGALMTAPAKNFPSQQSSQEGGKLPRSTARSKHASHDALVKPLLEAAGRLLQSAFRAPATDRSVQWGSDVSATNQRSTSLTTPREIQSLGWFGLTVSVLAVAGLFVVTGNRSLNRHTPFDLVRSELRALPEPVPVNLNSQDLDVVRNLPALEMPQKTNTRSDRANFITIGAQSRPRKNRATQLPVEGEKIAAKATNFVPEHETLSLMGNDEEQLTISPEEFGLLKSPVPYSIIKTTGDLGTAWTQGPDGWWNFSGRDKFALLNPISEGTVTFQVQRKKSGPIKFLGREKSSWVAFFIDAKNHLLFELESGQLIISEIIGGTKKLKTRLNVEKESSQVKIQFSASRALLSIGDIALLETAPDKSLIGGKFGFKGHVSIKGFQLVTP